MAFPTAVNDQITDAVNQENTKLPSDVEPPAPGHIYETLGHESGEVAQHLTGDAGEKGIQDTTTEGVGTIYSIDTAPDAQGTRNNI